MFEGNKSRLSYSANTFFTTIEMKLDIFHLWRVDNLSTVDKMAGPYVSLIERSHCITKSITLGSRVIVTMIWNHRIEDLEAKCKWSEHA